MPKIDQYTLNPVLELVIWRFLFFALWGRGGSGEEAWSWCDHMNSVLSIGLEGVQRGMQGLEGNAQAIAKIGTEEGPPTLGDVAEEVVGLSENRLQVEASVRVLKTADRTLGSLLDVHA